MDVVDVGAHRRFSAEKYQKVSLFETPGTAMDVYCLEPGQAQKVHAHDKTDKYYYVIEGTGKVTIGDQVYDCGPGWAALARPTVPHGIANDSQGRLVVLVFQSPKTF